MEIVVRAALVFLFLWGITRLTGRSSLGELSAFQLILYTAMGDLAQQAVTQQDYSLTSVVLTIGTFTLITLALSWLKVRFPRVRPLVHGRPVVVVRDGDPDLAALSEERMSLEDLLANARQQGIRRLSDVEVAVLETDGRVSFFTVSAGAQEGAPENTQVAG
ncbi:DUF421 domain-containing protein [Kineococcus sp. SYSU DK005]|uniref:DUF421 domain-containing protein n=1 Tax=Kineococcus sp. SYSU DK005 TaxID=3383126 RepID=UPI003D7DB1A0